MVINLRCASKRVFIRPLYRLSAYFLSQIEKSQNLKFKVTAISITLSQKEEYLCNLLLVVWKAQLWFCQHNWWVLCTTFGSISFLISMIPRVLYFTSVHQFKTEYFFIKRGRKWCAQTSQWHRRDAVRQHWDRPNVLNYVSTRIITYYW